MRKNEDPRLSFSTPEFREAQRIFTDRFKKNFDKAGGVGLHAEVPLVVQDARQVGEARRRGRQPVASGREREADPEGIIGRGRHPAGGGAARGISKILANSSLPHFQKERAPSF